MKYDADDVRARFERWYSDNGKYPDLVSRNPRGNYWRPDALAAWYIWECATWSQYRAMFKQKEEAEYYYLDGYFLDGEEEA